MGEWVGMGGCIGRQIDRPSVQPRIVPIQVVSGFTSRWLPLILAQVSALGQAAGYDAAEVANALGAGPWLPEGGKPQTDANHFA